MDGLRKGNGEGKKRELKDIVLKDKKSNLSSKGDYHYICITGVQDLLELREDEPKCKVKKKAAIDILFYIFF